MLRAAFSVPFNALPLFGVCSAFRAAAALAPRRQDAFFKHCKLGHDCADCGERRAPLGIAQADALRKQLPLAAFTPVAAGHGHVGGGGYLLAPKMYSVTSKDADLKGFTPGVCTCWRARVCVYLLLLLFLLLGSVCW